MFVKINDIDLKVKTCLTRQSKQEGMMKKTFTDFGGMLFFMGSGSHCMYMKNCIIPLDIVFIDSNLNIVDIFNNCEPCRTDDCPNYCSSGEYVLELPGGFCQKNNIVVGDFCSFDM
jgi:uncharacterized membrane protein (UPF0127 family)